VANTITARVETRFIIRGAAVAGHLAAGGDESNYLYVGQVKGEKDL
jgi:hypothetical protein